MAIAARQRWVRLCQRNNSADTEVSEEGGAGGAPGAEAEIPLQPVRKTMVRQDVPLQPTWKSTVDQISTCCLWKTQCQRKWMCPEGGCGPMESPCWSKLLLGPVALWRERSPCWNRSSGRTCGPVGHPGWSSPFLKDCNPWEGLTLEKFMEDCLLWEWPHTGAGEEREEEGAAERMCDEPTTTPIPHPPVPLRGRR